MFNLSSEEQVECSTCPENGRRAPPWDSPGNSNETEDDWKTPKTDQNWSKKLEKHTKKHENKRRK